jgi:hypothetical protein
VALIIGGLGIAGISASASEHIDLNIRHQDVAATAGTHPAKRDRAADDKGGGFSSLKRTSP